jgi:hypothetical protein
MSGRWFASIGELTTDQKKFSIREFNIVDDVVERGVFYEAKLTNATMVDDAIRFVSLKSNKKLNQL